MTTPIFINSKKPPAVSDLEEELDLETARDQSYIAVCNIGRQPYSDVYVIGPDLQYTMEGELIAKEKQVYAWIPEILSKLKMPMSMIPMECLPVIEDPLGLLVSKMHDILGDNHISGLYILGMFIRILLIIIVFSLHVNQIECTKIFMLESLVFFIET